MKNTNGEEPKKFYIKNISKEKKCLISIDPSSIQTTSLKNGDFVKIRDIEGMTELNNKIKKITEKSLTEFYIEDDSTNYNDYIKGGILEEYKKEIVKNFL